MARTVAALPAGSRITDYISLGVIAKFFPREKVREVLAQCKRASLRQRDLPAHVVVLCHCPGAVYAFVLPRGPTLSASEVFDLKPTSQPRVVLVEFMGWRASQNC
jgi:hypothetical protein